MPIVRGCFREKMSLMIWAAELRRSFWRSGLWMKKGQSLSEMVSTICLWSQLSSFSAMVWDQMSVCFLQKFSKEILIALVFAVIAAIWVEKNLESVHQNILKRNLKAVATVIVYDSNGDVAVT